MFSLFISTTRSDIKTKALLMILSLREQTIDKLSSKIGEVEELNDSLFDQVNKFKARALSFEINSLFKIKELQDTNKSLLQQVDFFENEARRFERLCTRQSIKPAV